MAVCLFSSNHQPLLQNKIAPECPLCGVTLGLKKGEDPNVRMEQHIASGCASPTTERRSNKCSFKGCKKRELVPVVCANCSLNFCLRHRMDRDHNCQGRAAVRSSAAGAAAARRAAHPSAASSSASSAASFRKSSAHSSHAPAARQPYPLNTTGSALNAYVNCGLVL